MNLRKVAVFCSLIISFTVAAQESFADIQVNSSAIYFGNVPLNTMKQGIVQVQNQGDDTVLVETELTTSFDVDGMEGRCHQDFQVKSSCSSVYPGNTCKIAVAYRPTSPYFRHCRLTVRDSDGSNSYVTISGRGTNK